MYADSAVLAFLADAPTEAEYLLDTLVQVAWGISLYENSDKTEFQCFKQEGAIFIQNDN